MARATIDITFPTCRSIHPDDIPRFAALDVTANFQPLWAYADEYITELTLPYISQEAANSMYPINSVLKQGGRRCFRQRLVGVHCQPLGTN